MVSLPSLRAKLRSVGKTIQLTTYRRDGSPVATPVSLAIDDGHRYFRTWDTSWKARRLRRNPSVEIADSIFGGKAAGPAVRAHVRQLSGEDERRARQALARQHPILQGVLVPLVHRLKRVRTLHYELVDPDERPAPPI